MRPVFVLVTKSVNPRGMTQNHKIGRESEGQNPEHVTYSAEADCVNLFPILFYRRQPTIPPREISFAEQQGRGV